MELTDKTGNKLVKSEEYSGEHPTINVVYNMEDGLMANTNYRLMVIAYSSAGNTSSQAIIFSKLATLSLQSIVLLCFLLSRHYRTLQQ